MKLGVLQIKVWTHCFPFPLTAVVVPALFLSISRQTTDEFRTAVVRVPAPRCQPANSIGAPCANDSYAPRACRASFVMGRLLLSVLVIRTRHSEYVDPGCQ
ncbi:hypothetical protein BC826DRAFT_1000203 [Russula brevipes]|nr:hypothetical protein BC826DRAFT_1000203 [Russula brevipes]